MANRQVFFVFFGGTTVSSAAYKLRIHSYEKSFKDGVRYMFDVQDKLVWGMAGLRLLSGSIEMIAALVMLYYGTIERAVTVNAFLSLVGPTVLILVTTIGLIGLADKLDFSKMLIVMCGVGLILYGVRS